MTTSGTYTFNLNRNQIIYSALRKIGAIAAGEIPAAQIVKDAAEQLNAMVKALASSGIHIWTETEATLFLQPNQVEYNLGATDHCTTTYVSTSLALDAPTGSTSLTVLSTVGMLNGSNLGVVIASGEIFWTGIVGAPTASSFTISAPLSDDAAAGAAVYAYDANTVRPLRVPMARRYNFISQIDTPMRMISRQEYRDLPNKTNTGIITQAFYDPRGGANTQGQMFVWPAPPDATNAMKFTFYRPLQDFNTSANTPDLPVEWINTLTWNLAKEMAPEYGVAMDIYQMIKERAAETLDLAMGFDREPESTFFGVDFTQMGR